MRALIAAGLLLLLVITGTAIVAVMRPAADRVVAEAGPQGKDTRQVGPFRRVQSNGSINLVIDAKAAAPGLYITGPAAETARVKTAVSGDTLTISQERGSGSDTITAYIEAPGLASVETQGAGNVTVRNLASPSFSFTLAGAGNVHVSGQTAKLTLELDGAGKIDAAGLTARDATATISGTGSMTVRATSSLRAEVDGVGTLTYLGNPAHVTRSVNGVGTIQAG